MTYHDDHAQLLLNWIHPESMSVLYIVNVERAVRKPGTQPSSLLSTPPFSLLPLHPLQTHRSTPPSSLLPLHPLQTHR